MAFSLTHGGFRHNTRDDTQDDNHHNDGNDHREDNHINYRTQTVVDRNAQHAAYGGIHFGAALFGWLTSTGIATILMSLLAAAGSALAVTNVASASDVTADTAKTVGLAGGILFLIVLAIAYYAGGYVAGRLSRFDGMRQGFVTWLIGVIVTIILGGVGAAIGAKYNILQQMNLPHLPVGASFTTGGLIVSVLALAVTLIAAIAGGKMGEFYHRKIDRHGRIDTRSATN
jgi:MFS family permease